MSLLIGFLTFILVLNCIFLVLLVLVQLPKKEAGAGLAFGAGAVDTLIGAGSGNALTKMTKYSAGIFLGLAIVLAVLNSQTRQGSAQRLRQELSKQSAPASAIPATQPTATPLNTTTTPAAAQTTPAQSTEPVLNLTPTTVPQTATPPASQQNTPATPPANSPATKQP